MKNGYLVKKEARDQAMLDIGSAHGAQKVLDYLTLVLRDQQWVGDDVFGRERIDRIVAGIHVYDKEFADAYTTKAEADVLQERLDRLLREVYGDELVPFAQRQPWVKQLSYKPRKEWGK